VVAIKFNKDRHFVTILSPTECRSHLQTKSHGKSTKIVCAFNE